MNRILGGIWHGRIAGCRYPSKPSARINGGRNECLVSARNRCSTAKADCDGEEAEDDSHERDVKLKILEASLEFVPSHGWTVSAISAGGEKLGYPSIIHGMFPNGAMDLIVHHNTTSNQKLVQYLDEMNKSYQDTSTSPVSAIRLLSTDGNNKSGGAKRATVEDAVKKRLEMIVPYIGVWSQALAISSYPSNIATSLSHFTSLIDDICYYSGDTAVDMGWYCRRALVGGVYKSTELFMLQDKSENYTETWCFLRRRLDQASRLSDSAKVAPLISASALITAKNMIGLSSCR